MGLFRLDSGIQLIGNPLIGLQSVQGISNPLKGNAFIPQNGLGIPSNGLEMNGNPLNGFSNPLNGYNPLKGFQSVQRIEMRSTDFQSVATDSHPLQRINGFPL